jgi:thiol-disulfide isomerase/thioredoxin
MKNKYHLLLLLSLMQLNVSSQSKLNIDNQIEIQFRDSIVEKTFGSFMTKPVYKSTNCDTLFYKVNTNKLFLPYSLEHSYEIDYQLIKSNDKISINQILQGKKEVFTYRSKMPIMLSLNHQGKNTTLNNYIIDYNNLDTFLYFHNKEILVADFSIENSIYKLYFNPYAGNLFQNFFFEAPEYQQFRLGDVFKINNKYFKMLKFDYFNRTGVLENVLDSSIYKYGFQEGKTLKEYNSYKDAINNNELFSNEPKNDNAYLFYFWGEWCFPCIKKIDSNKILFKKIDASKLNIVNVAAVNPRKENSEKKTIELIKEKGIPYFHLLDNSSILINKLRINTYPTYLLVSEEGEILYKGGIQFPADIQKFMTLLRKHNYLK